MEKHLSATQWLVFFQKYPDMYAVRDYGMAIITKVATTFQEKMAILECYNDRFGIGHRNCTSWKTLWDIAQLAATTDGLKRIVSLCEQANGGIYRGEGNDFREGICDLLEKMAETCEDWCLIYRYSTSFWKKRTAKKHALREQKTLADKIAILNHIYRGSSYNEEPWKSKFAEIKSMVNSFDDLVLFTRVHCDSNTKKEFIKAFNPTFEELEKLAQLSYDSSGVQGVEYSYLLKAMAEKI
ncbi:MAG: hypothetical protein LBO09_08525 [Candidatus Peribacteria bacterium]|nr:hypothetical protein [Candidatus Peribacteria bacterium]